MRDPDAKLEQIKHTALHFHIPLPEFADFDADATKHVHRAATKRFAEVTLHQAADFTLPANLFKDAAGLSILNGLFRGLSQGVFLIDAGDASTFLESHNKATQPCVMVVLGPTCPLNTKTCQTCNLPATDAQGAKVVIAACVHSSRHSHRGYFGPSFYSMAFRSFRLAIVAALRRTFTDYLEDFLH